MLPFVNNCLSHLFPQAALAETLGMTLRESHQICQLDLATLTEPLQAYIPKEEDIQIPLKKLEANSEPAPASEVGSEVPEATGEVVSEVEASEPGQNTPNPDQLTAETIPQIDEAQESKEDQSPPVESETNDPTTEPTTEPTSEPTEPSLETVKPPSEVAEQTAEEVKPMANPEDPENQAITENQPETEVKETKKD